MKKFAIATGGRRCSGGRRAGNGRCRRSGSLWSLIGRRHCREPARRSGYKVIVTRLSGGESSKCSVAALRPGQQIIQQVPTGGGDTAQQVVSSTAYIDVRC